MGTSLQSIESGQHSAFAASIQRASALVSRPAQWRTYVIVLLVADAACILVAFFLAGWVRFSLPLPFFNLDAKPAVPSLTLVGLVIIPFWLTIFAIQGLYKRRNLLGGLQEYSLLFRATAIGMLAIVILGFLRPIPLPARGWVALAWVFSVVVLTLSRFTLRRTIYYLRSKGFFLSPAMILGGNAEAKSLAEQLVHWHRSGLAVTGFVTNRYQPGEHVAEGLPALGDLNDLDALVNRYDIEELVIATSALDQDEILTVFKHYGMRRDVNLRLSSGLFEVVTTGLEVKELASVPLVRVSQARLSELDSLLKTGLDLIVASLLLVLTAPLLLLIAVAIKLDSPGPIIYRRRVVGLNGREFDGFKFRTMSTDADLVFVDQPDLEAEFLEAFKLKDDPRVTELGKILRKYSLDELPQLLNVMRREMSMVGPRMIAPEEVAKYEQWDMNLLTVLPGITGLWQVSGRSDLSYADRVQLDMRYIRNWSIWLDLHILMRTVSVVLSAKGAY